MKHLRGEVTAVETHIQDTLIQMLELRLSALNPMSILEKGFAIPVKNGNKVTSASDLSAGDSITVVLKDGKADCDVKSVNIP